MKKQLGIALALTMAAMLAMPVFCEEAAPMSYEEYVAAAVDDEVTVETYVQAVRAFGNNVATIYAQSEDGAVFIYEAACSEEDYAKLVEGQKIRVTGYKAEWAGELEIMDGTVEILEDEPYVAESVDLTDLLSSEDLIDYQNQKFVAKGMTVEPAGEDTDAAFLYNWDGSGQDGDDVYFNVSKDGQTYSFTVRVDMVGADGEAYQAVKDLAVGDVIDCEGFLYWYEGPNPHIVSVSAAEAEAEAEAE